MRPISWVSMERCSSCSVTSGWKAPSAISSSAMPTSTWATRRSALIMIGPSAPRPPRRSEIHGAAGAGNGRDRSSSGIVEGFGNDLVIVLVDHIARTIRAKRFDGNAVRVEQRGHLVHPADVLDRRGFIPAERDFLRMGPSRLGEAVGHGQMLVEPLEQNVDPREFFGAGFAGILQTDQC